MKKWKLRLFKSGSLAAAAAIMLTAFSLAGAGFRLRTSAEPGDNCTSRIEPSSYIENSIEGSALKRDYTYLYDDGMYADLMVDMGPFVYTKGNEEGKGALTYRLPYEVKELKITGIEAQGDPNNSFQGFWVSKDGSNWEEFEMTPTYVDAIKSAVDYKTRRGVSYYGTRDEGFQYVKVGFGRNWLPGINYLYIPPAEEPDSCTEKVDPAADGIVVDQTNTATNVTLARHEHSNSWVHDGVKGMTYNGVPNNGALVTFKLPYAVDELKLTGLEVHWPNDTRGQNRFLGFEVSADGENWLPFTMVGSNFTFINTAGERNDNLPKVNLPINRLGVTYYGTSDTRFQFVRIAFGRDWAPSLCNFYIPANTAGENCTTQLDPVEILKSVSDTGSNSSTYGRDDTYKHDGIGVLCFQKEAPNGGKMAFELPYAVDELKMTGVEIITDTDKTSAPGKLQFQGFRVSADGENWWDFDMTRQIDEVVGENNGIRREGVTFIGDSDTKFRYVEVTFGKDWIPGIAYFYVPPVAITGMGISGESGLLSGETATYTLTTQPPYAEIPSHVWSVENGTGTATITQEGVLTAGNPGTVTVKVETDDGSELTASKTVTILDESGMDNCTMRVDPVTSFQSFSDTSGGSSSTYGRDNTYKHDGIGIFCFQQKVDESGKMIFRMPYAVTELKMTGVEIITDGANTNPPGEFHFKNFRVSADGKTWQDFPMARRIDGFVGGSPNRREGVTLYGTSDTEFRYVEVTFGKNWIPGISYFYVPEADINLNHYELSLYTEVEAPTLEATLKEGITGTVTWTSSDPAVVKVDGTGKLTAVAAGTAAITATVGNYKATCEVTVYEGYGPDGCTTVIDAYAYISQSASVTPKRGGTIPIPGGATSPLVYAVAEMNEEPVFVYKLPHAAKELKMTGIDDSNNRTAHTFENFWVSADGENWEEFPMTRTYEGSGWIAVTLYGKADQEFRYFKVKFSTNAGWCPGIGHLYIPPADPGPEEKYGASISGGKPQTVEPEVEGSSFVAEENGAWHFETDTQAFAPGQVTYSFPFAITDYQFNVLDSFDPELSGGFTYWASADGKTYTQLDPDMIYGEVVSTDWRAFKCAAYGALDEADDIRYLQVRMTGETESRQPGILSVQLNATDYPEREPLPNREQPGEGEEELLDTFEGEGLTTEEGGKASDAFQMVREQMDVDGQGTMEEVLVREPGYSDSFLVYQVGGDVSHVDIRGYRAAGCEEEVWLWTSADGENWEFIEIYDWVEKTAITGNVAEFSISSDEIPVGTRYIKVELPIVENVTDLSLHSVQILYAGTGGQPGGPEDPSVPGDPTQPGEDVKTGVANHLSALLFTAALSGLAVVTLARTGRKKRV